MLHFYLTLNKMEYKLEVDKDKLELYIKAPNTYWNKYCLTVKPIDNTTRWIYQKFIAKTDIDKQILMSINQE